MASEKEGLLEGGAREDRKESVKEEKKEKVLCEPWNAKVREMKNGDIAFPFSVAFVMKKFENFESSDCRVDVKMTLIMRVKFSGL